ncbi:ATP-binding cassette domain-containing protein [Gimesia aquarii]|uniref:Sulfate/thiosulfate import ATP-binding protein CysA n=1 Tax=Gimesia aquarii TaxID=2527964 RepID=A0A517X0P8_9PLAN|nr:ATP-binding cassette domain-containing protein [Gimesia aquarii]QDU11079.1 Sulfate/thiosulfate import ATP-binding protein CysA [Gimesia aquarii]
MNMRTQQSESSIWSLKNVSLRGVSGDRLVDVDLEIPQGITAIMGYSGAGKTSLLNLLVEYECPHQGSVVRRDHSFPSDSTVETFWVPHSLGLWPQYDVQEHLALVHPDPETLDETVEELLNAFRLTSVRKKYPGQLSQGEASRLSVARALASQAKVLVMDEPLVHVDQAHWPLYWDAIRHYCEKNKTSLVFSTHMPELVLKEAQHVVCLDEGAVVYAGAVYDLYYAPPSYQIGMYLGPVNDLSDVKAKSSQNQSETITLVRPEQLTLIKEESSEWEVRQTTFSGALEKVEMVHRQTQSNQTFYHRPPRATLKPGDRISIHLLLLLFCLLTCFGCHSDSAPELSFPKIVQWSLPSEGTKVPAPRSVNVGPKEELYVLDNAGRVLVYNPENELVRKWMMPDYDVGKPEGICFLKNGQIAVADTHYHRVVFFDDQGNVQKMLGEQGEGPSQFIYPVSIVQDPSGNIYVGEYGGNDRVQKFSEEGEFLLEFGEHGTEPGQFERASGMVWHQGKIYVADASNNCIQVFSDEGAFLEVLGTKTGGIPLYYPYDIAIDRSKEEFYIVEYGAGRITKTDLEGRVLGRFGKTGSKQGEFVTPWGVTVNSKDQVFVADTGNRLIVKLIP